MSKTWDIRGARGANDQIVTVATVHELEYHGEWMVEEFVTVTIVSATPVELRYGDFLDYRGERFYIDYDPSVIKKSSSGSYGEAFTYDNVKLYSSARQLNDTSFRDVVLNDNKLHTAMSVFAFFASSVEDLADRIQANLYRSSSDQWVVFTPNKYRWLQRKPSFVQESVWDSIYGSSDPSAIVGNRDINVECQNLSCTGALVLSYNKFNVPYIVRGHSIIIGAPAVDAGRIFKYGLGNGLYEIERTGEDQQLVTKLYAYGSEENLPLNYYANLHKKTVVKGVRDAKDMGQGLTYYGLKTNTPWGDVRNGLLNADSMCMLSYGGMTMKTFFDPMVYDEEGEAQYLYVRFDHDATTDHDKEFYNALGDGEVTITVTGGVNINSWPSSLIVNEAQDSYPALLSINKLMLPGFPDMSLNDFVHGAANGDFIMPGYDDLNTSMRVATSLLAHYTFSGNITEPWIKSHLSGTVGLKEGNLYFDGTNNLDDIKPTIENTGADVVTEGSAITDNGYLADNADASFFLTVASNSVIDWQVAYTKRTEDISLEMKTGYCTGRKFKLLAEPESVDGGWKLKLEREKDTSTSRYFPYRESDTGSYAQVLAGDKFVVTGIDLPKGYVEAASVRLLIAACRELGKIDHPKRTYLPKIDEIYMQRQDDEAKASGGAVQSLHDSLKAGMTLSVLDTDLEISIESTIDVITIKENGNNGIPTYDVVLRNDKEKNLAATVQDQIDKAVGDIGSGLGISDMQLEAILKQLGSELFLSKKDDDIASGLITFMKGLKVGDYREGESGAYISPFGDAELKSLIVRLKAKARELEVGDYEEGLDGAHIDEHGNTEVEDLWARGRTTLGKDGQEEGYSQVNLEVKGSSVFNGNLSSPDFLSGWPTGTGWALQRKEYVNPAGQVEYKYVLECDGANIRGTLRVYEFIISQLLGENDNRIFTAMLEVHHYDPSTGRVWLSTNGGKLYMPFRKDDCIMVQQYQPGNTGAEGGDGYVTKSYELLITAVGSGGQTDENGDRLDWVTFTNFTTMMEGGTPEDLITRYDTFCRIDNLTDPERKGIIQMVAVGTNAPYMDIIYGRKTNPDIEGFLKGRLGNLEGINHHLFGWLQGFGEYLINSYIVGDVRLRRTGQSLDTTLEILNGKLMSTMTETVNEVTGEDNYLSNAAFSEMDAYGQLKDWTISADDVTFYTVGGEAVVSSVGTLADARSFVKTEEDDGRMVLHMENASIRQSRLVMRSPETHKEYIEGTGDEREDGYVTKLNKLYLTVRVKCIAPGTLRIGFPESAMTEDDAMKVKTALLERSDEWKTLKWSGTWDGKSDFVMSFTGELECSLLVLSDDKMSDMQTEYSTSIVQTSRNITFEAKRISANETSVARLDLRADQIQSTVESNYRELDGRVTTNSSRITQTAEQITTEVTAEKERIDGVLQRDYSTTVQTASMISSSVTSEQQRIDGVLQRDYSTTSQTATAISTAVTSEQQRIDGVLVNNYSTTEQTASMIKTRVESYGYQTASQVNSLISNHTKWNSYTTLEQTDSKITSTVTAKYIRDTGVLNSYLDKDQTADLYYNKTQINQTENNINLNVARVEQEIVSIADVAMWEQGDIDWDASAGSTYEDIKETYAKAVRYKNLVSVTTETSFLLTSGYTLRFAYFNSSKKLTRVTTAKSPNTYGIVNVSANSGEPYVAVILYHAHGSNITPSIISSTGISVTKDNVVTSAYLDLYVDKNSVSWLTGSADNVIFNFNNRFQIQYRGATCLEMNGDNNLYITGELKPNSTIGTVLPMKVDENGNLIRKTVDDTWIANYAGRFVKYKNFLRNNDIFEMRPSDDLFLSNGNYDPKNVYLPLNPANGKVISIKNIGGKTVIRPAKNSTQMIRMTDEAIDHFDLNTYDRIEFVFYEGTWWGNVSPI